MRKPILRGALLLTDRAPSRWPPSSFARPKPQISW